MNKRKKLSRNITKKLVNSRQLCSDKRSKDLDVESLAAEMLSSAILWNMDRKIIGKAFDRS